MKAEVEEWHSLLRALPDTIFLEIMSNYLGGIQTPYNKNELLARLENLLNKPENQKRIVSSCSPQDIKLLSIINSFSQPTEAFLKHFCGKESSPYELGARLINLEERLMIFRKSGNKGIYYILSPLLPQQIKEALSPNQFIESQKIGMINPQDMPLFNGSFLTCFISVISQESQVSNTDGSLKKRFINSLFEIFPGLQVSSLENEELETEKIFLVFNTLKGLKLINESSGKWRCNRQNLDRFSGLDRQKQLLWIWSSLIIHPNGSAEKWIPFIEALIHFLPIDRAITESSLQGLMLILMDSVLSDGFLGDPHRIIGRLLSCHFLIETEKGISLHPMIPKLFTKQEQSQGSLFIHATYDVNLTPEVPFSYPLALSLRCDRYDSFAQLKLTSSSFKNLLKGGFPLARLQKELKERFAQELSQNVLFTLQDWERDYDSIKVWDGLVLELEEERRSIAQQTGLLDPFIKRELAPGIYLMDRLQKEAWEEALLRMGVETIPHSRGDEQPLMSEKSLLNQALPELNTEATVLPHFRIDDYEAWEHDSIDYKEELLKSLSDVQKLEDFERSELDNRIQRGVIILPNQIKEKLIRKEMLTAKGLDYQSKLRLIQSVIGNRAYHLEVTLPYGDFDLKTYSIIPKEIENAKDSQALLRGIELPDRPFECPIRRISLVKKVRSSLF